MIQVNLVGDRKLRSLLDEAIEKFYAERQVKTFSQRHPELGPMITCQVCKTRHRSVKRCVQKFAIATHNPDHLLVARPANGWVGKNAFQGQRLTRRPSPLGCRIVQMVRDLLPKYEGKGNAMKLARAEAVRTIRDEKKDAAKIRRDQQKLSRAINR